MPDLRFCAGRCPRALGTHGQLAGLLHRRAGEYGSVTSKAVVFDRTAIFRSTVRCSCAWGCLQWLRLASAHRQRKLGMAAFFGYNSQWDDVVIGDRRQLHSQRFGRLVTTSIRILSRIGVLPTTPTTKSSASIQSSGFRFGAACRAGYAMRKLPALYVRWCRLGQANRLTRIVSATHAGRTWRCRPCRSSDTKTSLVYGYSAGVGRGCRCWWPGCFCAPNMNISASRRRSRSNINTRARRPRLQVLIANGVRGFYPARRVRSRRLRGSDSWPAMPGRHCGSEHVPGTLQINLFCGEGTGTVANATR